MIQFTVGWADHNMKEAESDKMDVLKRIVAILSICLFLTSMTVVIDLEEALGAEGSFGGGSGTDEDPFIIEDVWDLQNMSSNLSAHYVLKNDINASITKNWNSGAGFMPIGGEENVFRGGLDGRNHTISGLFINRSSLYNVGLFGYVDYWGHIKNVGLISNRVYGDYYVGGFVGCNDGGSIDNSYTTGDVSGRSYVGGLIGKNSNGKISNCHTSGTISGDRSVGGLIGSNYWRCTINRCYAIGDVNGNREHVGGLVGDNVYKITISECYAAAKINGEGNYVGGLVGRFYEGSISNSYSVGSMRTYGDYIGGLVGYNYASGTISDCYSATTIIGTGNHIGGLLGLSHGWVEDSYWDIERTGLSESSDGIGKTTVEMKTETTFTDEGWDFADIWCIIENQTYPFFIWDDTESPTANAGPDQLVNQGGIVEFDASESRDDKGIIGYVWNFTDGSPVTLYGIHPNYQFDHIGVFPVTLNVTDALGKWDTDTMTVTVPDVTPPKADAGPDQTVRVDERITFDGGKSTDNIGIVDHTWTFMDSTPVTLKGIRPTYQFENPGEYEVTLKVADAAGHWDSDTMTVTVRDITPPVADAGPDQMVPEGTLVEFNGNGSYDNVGITEFKWTFLDIYEVVRFGKTAKYRFNNIGVFEVKLHVRDAGDNWNTDNMTVTVTDVTSPIINDLNHGDPATGSKYTLNFEFSDNNELLSGFLEWWFDDGPSTNLSGILRSTTVDVPLDAYVLHYRVGVCDDHGNWKILKSRIDVIDGTDPYVEIKGGSPSTSQNFAVQYRAGDNREIERREMKYSLNDDDGQTGIQGIDGNFSLMIPDDAVTITFYANVKDAEGNSASDVRKFPVNDSTIPVISEIKTGDIMDNMMEVNVEVVDNRELKTVWMEIEWEGGSDNITLERYQGDIYRSVIDFTSERIHCRIGAQDGSGNVVYSVTMEFVRPPDDEKKSDSSWILIVLLLVVILILIGIILALFFILRNRKRNRELTPEEIRTLKSIYNNFGMGTKREEMDCYKILQIDRKASQAEIRKRYRKLAGIHHPDRFGNGVTESEEMVRLNCAKEILLDEEKRRIHDLYLRQK